MKRFKKVLALVLAGVLALAMLTACGETADPDSIMPEDSTRRRAPACGATGAGIAPTSCASSTTAPPLPLTLSRVPCVLS